MAKILATVPVTAEVHGMRNDRSLRIPLSVLRSGARPHNLGVRATARNVIIVA